MRTLRMSSWVKSYLKTGPKTIVQIQQHINEKTRDGTTVSQLGNVLSKDKDVFKLDDQQQQGYFAHSSSYPVTLWALKDPDMEVKNPSITYLGKLKPDQVRDIRHRRITSSTKQIAKEYGMGVSTIRSIVSGQSYAWVD